MKIKLNVLISIAVLFILTWCAGHGTKIPQRYNLDLQFPRVNKITDIPDSRETPIYSYPNEYKGDGKTTPSRMPIPHLESSHMSIYELVKVDEQSVIFRAEPDNNYLLVLLWPVPNMLSDIQVRITAESNIIYAERDHVLIGDSIMCPIARIYVIGDDEHAIMIKDQILGKPKKYFLPGRRKQI